MRQSEGLKALNEMSEYVINRKLKKYARYKAWRWFAINCVLLIVMCTIMLIANPVVLSYPISVIGKLVLIFILIAIVAMQVYLTFFVLYPKGQRIRNKQLDDIDYPYTTCEYFGFDESFVFYCLTKDEAEWINWQVKLLLNVAVTYGLRRQAEKVVKKYVDLPVIARNAHDTSRDTSRTVEFNKYRMKYRNDANSLVRDLYQLCRPYIKQEYCNYKSKKLSNRCLL